MEGSTAWRHARSVSSLADAQLLELQNWVSDRASPWRGSSSFRASRRWRDVRESIASTASRASTAWRARTTIPPRSRRSSWATSTTRRANRPRTTSASTNASHARDEAAARQALDVEKYRTARRGDADGAFGLVQEGARADAPSNRSWHRRCGACVLERDEELGAKYEIAP